MHLIDINKTRRLAIYKTELAMIGVAVRSFMRFLRCSIRAADFIFTSLPERLMIARHKSAYELVTAKLASIYALKLASAEEPSANYTEVDLLLHCELAFKSWGK